MSIYKGNKKWSIATGMAYGGTIIQAVFSLIGTCILMYLYYNLTDIVLSEVLHSLGTMGFEYYKETITNYTASALIFYILSLLGYIIYLIGLCLWKRAQRSYSSESATKNIMLTELIMPGLLILTLVVCNYYPEWLFKDLFTTIMTMITAWAATIVATVVLLLQFKSLTKEETWSEKAREGADDLRLSYAYFLWIQGVVIVSVGLSALTVYSSYTKLKSMQTYTYGMNRAIEGISTLTQEIHNLVSILKVLMFFTIVIIFIFALLQTIYRIMGWNKIRLGGNEETHQLAEIHKGEVGGGFCHKCGTQLPEGSAFCPGCGTAVVRSAKVHLQDETVDETSETIIDEAESSDMTPSYDIYEEEQGNRKRWLIWSGIAAGIIAIAAGLWTLWSSSGKIKPNAYVFTEHSVVFKNVEDGIGVETIADIEYGTPVECRTSEFDKEGIWIKVAFEKDGRVNIGFMVKGDLLNTEDFLLLNVNGMHDNNFRAAIPINIERLALLNALKSVGPNWSLEGRDKNGRQQANTKRVKVRGARPSENCLGLILHNTETGERTFFLYSTPDLYSPRNTREPVFLYKEIVKRGDAIYDVNFKKRKGVYEVTYTMMPTDSDDSYSCEESAEDQRLYRNTYGGARWNLTVMSMGSIQ